MHSRPNVFNFIQNMKKKTKALKIKKIPVNMKTQEIKLTNNFKRQASRTIFSIILFILVYLLLLGFAVALTISCVYLGYKILSINISFLSIILGVGSAGLGILVLFFLLKFIFKVSKTDRSHLVEINRSDEPELFLMIDEIVKKVNTSSPKKVYLSTEVNAAVFYDSSFWSMFLPIRKNLIIGIGLVNSITADELKAILSHEFGHFSQDSMRVGSYVYNVNQIIHNLLFDNDSFQNLVYSLSNFGYFSIFVVLAVKIIEGIQWVLKKMYALINKSYMGLSREMEFHADQIAASVSGSKPMIESLLRLDLAATSMNVATSFYEARISENKKSENIFKEQFYIMSYLANEHQLEIKNKLPYVSLNEIKKFNKSKLVIDNQWESHPTLEQRIDNLSSFRLDNMNGEFKLANDVFQDIESSQKKLTKKLFDQVEYKEEVEFISFNDFKKLFTKEFNDNSFDEFYNGYYDNYNPQVFDLDTEINDTIEIDSFYKEENKERVIELMHLKNDILTIEGIQNKSIPVKSFDYNGIKYKRKQSKELLKKLNDESEKLSDQIKKYDIKIYAYFNSIAQKLNDNNKLVNLYKDFFSFDKEYESKASLYNELINATQFFHHQIPSDQIIKYVEELKTLERRLKKEIKVLVSDNTIASNFTNEVKVNFDSFLSHDWSYFRNENYQDKNIQLLFEAINNYLMVLNKTYFERKKTLLNYQIQLLKSI